MTERLAEKRLVKRLKRHLDNLALVRALSLESEGEHKVEQADAKSSVKAKREQAA